MKTWQIITLVIACTLGGVLLTLYFKKSDNTIVKDLEQKIKKYESTIDSLQLVNKYTVIYYKGKIDSVDGVVKNKKQYISTLTKEVNDITKKYQDIRNNQPDFDTTVRYYEVLAGRECIEKMVKKELQLDGANSIIADLENKINLLTNENKVIQKQFDKSITLNRIQNLDLVDAKNVLKKEQRKLKWQRIGLITEGVIIVAGAVYISVSK